MQSLVVTTRNGFVESIHQGYICIVDAKGSIIHSVGDAKTKIFIRSAAKPFQVIPLIESGAADAFNYNKKEIAIACASHSGQWFHQDIVRNIMSRLDLSQEYLQCGIMEPINQEEKRKLLFRGERPNVFHHSCSGKHAAMLTLAKYLGYSLENYEKPHHPIQQQIKAIISNFTEIAVQSIPIGIDGCGVPAYLLPLYNIALSYAKMMKNAEDPTREYNKSCGRIVDAMIAYPEMVAGEGEFDTELNCVAKGKLIGKVGSEAVYCIGIKERNIGVGIKIADGNQRALYPIVIRVLFDLGVLDTEDVEQLSRWYRTPVINHLNEIVGAIFPVYSLHDQPGRDLMGCYLP